MRDEAYFMDGEEMEEDDDGSMVSDIDEDVEDGELDDEEDKDEGMDDDDEEETI